MTTDNITTTVIIHRFSSIFTHFHSFPHVVTAYFSLILHMLSLLIFHQFSSIFHVFSLILLLCRHVVTSSTFFKKFYLPVDTHSDTFTHFHSFSLISTVSHLFFIVFHSFSLLCRHVVTSSPFFRGFFPWTDGPAGHFPEHMNNRKF